MTDLEGIAEKLYDIATAITPARPPGTDAAGGTVDCVTEALMGHTAGLMAIAEAIRYHADIVGAALSDVSASIEDQSS